MLNVHRSCEENFKCVQLMQDNALLTRLSLRDKTSVRSCAFRRSLGFLNYLLRFEHLNNTPESLLTFVKVHRYETNP